MSKYTGKTGKIIKYKTYLEHIHIHCLRKGAAVNENEIDAIIKNNAELTGISCSDMTIEQLDDLLEATSLFADNVNYDPPKDHIDKQINLNI